MAKIMLELLALKECAGFLYRIFGKRCREVQVYFMQAKRVLN